MSNPESFFTSDNPFLVQDITEISAFSLPLSLDLLGETNSAKDSFTNPMLSGLQEDTSLKEEGKKKKKEQFLARKFDNNFLFSNSLSNQSDSFIPSVTNSFNDD